MGRCGPGQWTGRYYEGALACEDKPGLRDVKTESSAASVPLPGELVAILRRHLEREMARRSLPLPADLHRLPPRGRPRRGGQLHRHRCPLRTARLHVDRQRVGLHLTIHPRPQRIRTPPRCPRSDSEERASRSSPNPRQSGTLPPNPQTLAGTTTQPATLAEMQTLLDTFQTIDNTERPHRAYRPRTTPAQAYTATPKAAPGRHHPRPCTSASATTPSTNSANSPCATPAASATSVPVAPTPTPKSTSSSPQQPSRHRTTRPQSHRRPPHRPQPQLLAKPKKPRPMAGASCNR